MFIFFGHHRKTVARPNWLLWPTPQARELEAASALSATGCGDATAVFVQIYQRKSEDGYFFRVLIVTADGGNWMVQDGRVLWHIEGALADVKQAVVVAHTTQSAVATEEGALRAMQVARSN